MSASPTPIYEFGDFRLDATKRVLLRRGAPVPLTPRVFETLLYMVEHHHTVLEKDRLMEAVWPDVIVEENNLTQNISTLRRVFGETPGSHRFIVTLPGRGYRFVADVKTRGNGATPSQAFPTTADHRTEIAANPPPDLSRPASRRKFIFIVAGAIVLCLFGTLVLFRGFQSTKPPATTTAAPVVIPEKSIAVLPFANLTSDQDTAYFAEGIKDEILTRLSKIAALKVISRTSTQEYALKPHNVREIGQRLGVVHVVEGSVQKVGDTVRVTVQLIHAPSDTHLWAESYDRKLIDVLQVESEIAQRIVRALAATVTGREQRALAALPTANVEAYEAYLRGRYFWNKRTPEGFKEAVVHLSRAVELDPAYAQAHAGLADAVYFRGAEDGAGYEEVLGRTRALLEKALSLDETLADAHASLGLLAMNSGGDWAQAEQQFKRAIELDPNYATAHQWYGEFLAYMGRFEEAIAESGRARELDPLSLIINTDLAKVHTLARRPVEAIGLYEAALKLDPEFPEAHALLGLTYSLAGRHEEAIAELRKIRNVEEHPAYCSFLAYVYGAAGRSAESRQLIDQLNKLSSREHVVPYWFALAWAGVGDREQAILSLEAMLQERPPFGAITLKVNPVFDGLRSDPRYAELLRRAKFEP